MSLSHSPEGEPGVSLRGRSSYQTLSRVKTTLYVKVTTWHTLRRTWRQFGSYDEVSSVYNVVPFNVERFLLCANVLIVNKLRQIGVSVCFY